MTDSNSTIHQTVHGYQRGHRLLASSTELDQATASLIARTSDSAPNYRINDGPYLTGYALPDGRYVMARTWPAMSAERPNTVWTHSLILPRAGGRGSGSALREILGRVPRENLSGRLPPVVVPETVRGPIRVDPVG